MFNTGVMPPKKLKGFIKEVFFNLDEIRTHHQRMLAALFDRQRDQHPLLQSVADIILDSKPLSTLRVLSHQVPSSQSALTPGIRGVHKALPSRRGTPPVRVATQHEVPVFHFGVLEKSAHPQA